MMPNGFLKPQCRTKFVPYAMETVFTNEKTSKHLILKGF